MKACPRFTMRVCTLLLVVTMLPLAGCGTFEIGLERQEPASDATPRVVGTAASTTSPGSASPGNATGVPGHTATPTPAQMTELGAEVTSTVPVLLPTATLKPTRPATETPTPTPLPPLPRILSFAASASPADPAGAVTLAWEVRGASSVTLQWTDPNQDSVIRHDLPLSGSLSVEAQEVKFEGGDHLRFWLSARDAGGQVAIDDKGTAVEAQLDVPLQTDLRIDSFTASPDPIQRGGTVTLTWSAPGAVSAGITRLSPEGDIFLTSEATALPASGSITLSVPQNYPTSVKYYLGARDINGVLRKAYVTVGIICPFESYLAPSCPLTQDYVWAAYEPFEGGHMVWRSDRLEIYVLYDDGSYETFEDTWQEGDPVDLPGLPPSGFYAPVRGFGHLWAGQPNIREQLGWATAEENGYTMQVEVTHGGSGHYPGRAGYLTVPEDRVVSLSPFHPTWQFVD